MKHSVLQIIISMLAIITMSAVNADTITSNPINHQTLNSSARTSDQTTSSKAIVDGMNHFALDMYHTLFGPGDNVIFSPYGLSFLLDILTIGADGNTQSQLIKLLYLQQVQLPSLISNLNQINMTLLSNNASLNLANALWVEASLTYQPAFTSALNKLQNNHVYKLDFMNESAALSQVKIINDWVYSNTNGHIKNLLFRNDISTSSKLLLTSALYYEGLWTIPFDPVNTVEGQFTTSANKSVTVPMMHGDGKYIYTEDSQRQMLLLTYKNSTLAMAFILPKNKENFGNIIRAFDYSQLMKLNQTSLTNAPTIAVSLPRFNIDKRFTDELTTALYYLGFSDASNFTNLAKPVQGELLPLNKIIQETLVEVSEEGATASMSTVAIKKQTSTARDPNIIYFIADHPFIYVLFDIKTGLILVIGHVATLPDMHQPDEIQSLHINELMRLIARITSNADSLAQMKGTYNYSAELTPDDKVRTSWDSIVTISNQTKDSYTVTITKVPSEVCKAVQVKLSQSPKYVAKNKCDTAEPADFTYIYNR